MDDKIVANCQHCNGQFRLPAKFSGKTIRCPQCQQPLSVPVQGIDKPVRIAKPAVVKQPAPPVQNASGARLAAWDRAKPQQRQYDESYEQKPMRKAPRKIDRNAPQQPRGKSGRDKRGQRQPEPQPRGRRQQRGYQDEYAYGGRYDDRYQQPKKNNLMIFIGIGAAALILLIVVIAIAVSGTEESVIPGTNITGDPAAPVDSSGKPIQPTQEELKQQEAESFINTLREICDKAIDDNNLNSLFDSLNSYQTYLDKYTDLKPIYEKYADTFFEMRKEDIDKIENEKSKANELYKLAQTVIKFVNDMEKAKPIFLEAKMYADIAFDYRLVDRINSDLGWKKYVIPETEEWDEIQTLMIEKDLLEALYRNEQQWLSPEEYGYVIDLENQIYNSYRSQRDHWEAEGGFGRRIQQVRVRLWHDPFLRNFRFNVIEANPFAIFLEEDDNREWTDIVRERTGTLNDFWEQIKENWVVRLGMKSNMVEDGDTLDNPFPMSFVSFKDRASYDKFLEGVRKEMPDFARAYYSMVTKTVMFYQDKDEQSHFEFAVVAHESAHMVHDRFAPKGLREVQSYFIVEGFAELMAAHKKVGDRYIFQDINYPARMQMFGFVKQVFDNGTYVHNAVKGNFPVPRQDWNLVPIECLMTMRNMGFTIWYGNNLTNFYSQVFAQHFANTRDNKYLNKAAFLQQNGGANFVHGMFYATAWAFTKFLTERYPDQYDKMFLRGTEGEEMPLVFNEAFNLGLDLPTINDLWGPRHIIERNNQKIIENTLAQMSAIHNSPKVIALQEEFNAWLEVQYEKVMGRKLPNPTPK